MDPRHIEEDYVFFPLNKDTAVALCDVSVSFNGKKAIDNLRIDILKQELRFIVGPNGAGKTTMLDIICGKTKWDEGTVFYYNTPLSHSPPHKLNRMGIGRKFQSPSVFSDLTVVENMEIALPKERGLFQSIFHKINSEEEEYIKSNLERVGLFELRSILAGELSHGQKQWLEIAMVLLQKPKVVLVDEPVAGMTRRERDMTGEILISLLEEDCTIIAVEHDMDFVAKFASKVSVLHEGRLLCEGSFDEISENEEVKQVYLGRGAVH